MSSQLEGNTNASIRELLKYNKRNAVEINKILNILVAAKPTDANFLNDVQDETQYGEQGRENQVEPRIPPFRRALTAQSTEKRIRCCSLGEVNKGFEHSEFTHTCTPIRNDDTQRRMSAIRRSSTVSISTFNFSSPVRRFSSISRRSLNLRKDSRVSSGSISL